MKSSSAPTLDELRRAARRAERLDERLVRLRRTSAAAGGPGRPLLPWARAFAGSEATETAALAALERRLSWDALDPTAALAALGEVGGERSDAGLAWFDRILEWDVVGRSHFQGKTTPTIEDVAFGELWRPWVDAALDRLDRSVPEPGTLPVASRARLAEGLGLELARLGERAAYAQFERERALSPLGTGAYRRFVERQLELGLLPLYLEHPVLLRQTGELVEGFVAAWAELFVRWRADRELLAAELGAPAATIVELEPMASDRHAGGRRVVRLAFEGGLEVVYKPRSVAAEARWAELCSALREQGLAAIPTAATALERDGYGWMEWVRHSEPESEEELELWFRRAGALVALADLLGVEDLHAENLIATREGPVAVDLELILRPARGARDRERGSVFDSGLVARRTERARGDRVARWAGLGDREPERVEGRARGWSGLATDDLRPLAVAVPATPLANLPRSGGRSIPLSERATPLLDGYRETYRFLLAHRAALLAPGGALARFDGIATRLLFRPSQEYATLLDALSAPAAQHDAIAAGLLLEAALRPFATATERPRLWPLVAEERAALQALDIPRFEAVSDAEALPLGGGGQLAGVLLESGVARMRRRFALWSDADLEAQAAELERESRAPLLPTDRSGAPERGAGRDRFERARFERAARELAGRIVRRRLELGMETPGSADDDLARRVRRASLYDGLAGEALLLAALPPAWRDDTVETAASLAGVSFRAAVASLAESAGTPLGAMQGAGSWLWTLAWLERFAPDVDSKGLAASVVGSLTSERLAADRRLDLEGGLAGLVLGLLAAHEIWPDLGALELARAAGQQLLVRAEPVAGRPGALGWRGEIGRPLAGFAHGASGIARALAALAMATKDERFEAAALGALAFERALFDPQRRNWPVLLADGPAGEPRSTWMTAWCHGATGIGLARLHAAAMGGVGKEIEVELEGELEAALGTTIAAGAAPRDHLCCGSAGRASILALAARNRDRPEWRRAAETSAAAMLDRASAAGDFELPRGNDPLVAAEWGMMRGRVGVAWCLAELAGAALPGLLALELPGERERRFE